MLEFNLNFFIVFFLTSVFITFLIGYKKGAFKTRQIGANILTNVQS